MQIAFLILFMFFCALFETASTALVFVFTNSVIGTPSSIVDRIKSPLVFFFGESVHQYISAYLAALIAVVYLLRSVLNLLNIKFMNQILVKSQAQLSAKLFRSYLSRDYAFHTKNNSAELLRAVTTDTANLFLMLNKVMGLISDLIMTAVLMTFLVSLNPVMMTLVALVLVFATLFSNFVVLPLIKAQGAKSREQYVNMIKYVHQATGGLKTILANRKQQYFVNQYTEEAAKNARASAKFNLLNALPRISVETISMVSIFLFTSFALFRRAESTSIIPTLSAMAIAAVRLIPSMNKVNSCLGVIAYNYPSLDHVYHILQNVELTDHQQEANTLIDRSKQSPLNHGLIVKNLSFGFSDEKALLFDNISLQIPARKAAAFIGPTGAGKTTLADLILGLQKPMTGNIKADNIDINENPDWWAQQVGYIPQKIYICDDTVRRNVAFGFRNQDIDDEKVWSCLKDAQIDEYIRSLPDKLETRCGEAGVRFSGGQIQRIGIARALYSDPQFIVMDEATSALDNETEQAVMEAIDKLSGKKTLLIIAHRLTTIRNCDVVYRINNGNVKREEKSGLELAKESVQ